MEAKERPLNFLNNQVRYIVPYFQRDYVWDEENWEGIWDELTSAREDCFLGSIILKEEKYPGSSCLWKTIIDGQQRLTTLTILLRAFLDYYLICKSKDPKDPFLLRFTQMIFYDDTVWEDDVKTVHYCKIQHSKHNRKEYSAVIEGKMVSVLKTDEEELKSASRIIRCYKYFFEAIKESVRRENSDAEIIRVLKKLTYSSSNILVVIDLGVNENEQIIFDAINSTGVKLTASDIIKNALFQKLSALGNDAEALYDNTWHQTFEDNNELIDMWLKAKGLGQNQRSFIDFFFYSFAIIKGFFVVPTDRMADLAEKYKKHIAGMSYQEAESFTYEICKYAEQYKDIFISFDASGSFKYSNSKMRLLQILNTTNITAFDPFILYAIMEHDTATEDELLFKLECFVMRHYIIGNSNRMGSFLKDTVRMIEGSFDFDAELADEAISDLRFEQAMKNITNAKAKLVLFWIEMYRHSNPESDLYNAQLGYNYELEHIMPQKWQSYWGLDKLPILNSTGEPVPTEEGVRIRNQAVYEIGNMTLLTSRLNKELQNACFADKVNGAMIGNKTRPGMKQFSALSVTKEVVSVSPLVWDEKTIRERTIRLTEESKKIWPCCKN